MSGAPEEWRDVVGYEGIYEVSSLGRVRTHKDKTTSNKRYKVRRWKQRFLSQKVGKKDNMHRVHLWKGGKDKTFLVHRLVAFAFLEKPPEKDFVNHLDGDRFNNSVSNLEWCTSKENNEHAFATGLMNTEIPIALTDVHTTETREFRSMSHASIFLGRSSGYVSGLLKKNRTITDGYEISVINKGDE